QNTAASVVSGWLSLYGIPLVLIAARGRPSRNAFWGAGTLFLLSVPLACFCGLATFVMSGWVGLIGTSVAVILLAGWFILLIVAIASKASPWLPVPPDPPVPE